MYFGLPTSSFGYYRGSPTFNGGDYGTGSGPQVSGSNVFSAGQGSTSSTSSWTPTILYLFVLILIEMFVFAFIARHI